MMGGGGIAIVGCGAVGTAAAAALAQAWPGAARAYARQAFSALEVEGPDGARAQIPLAAITDPALAEPAAWTLLCVKAYDAPAAAAQWLPRLTAAGGRVAVLQNGVEHQRGLEGLGLQALPVVVDLPADRLGPGRARLRRAGRLTVPAGPAGAAFCALFAGTAITAAETADFTSAAWEKLCVNALGAVNALALAPGGLGQDPAIAAFLAEILAEAMAVGRTEGARFAEDLPARLLAHHAKPSTAVNSLHADRLAGRPLEIEARNGAIVRIGARCGVPTPANALVTALLRAADAARLSETRPSPPPLIPHDRAQ